MPGSPERDAQIVLDTFWSVAGELPLPIDPVQIARKQGIEVFKASMEAGVSGALVNSLAAGPTIYLNERDSTNRQRFTCAHELGHYTKRVNRGETEFEFVDRRDKMAGTGLNDEEVYANQFAAQLLMPTTAVRKLSRTMEPLELAWHFDVSADAMNFRLANLRIK